MELYIISRWCKHAGAIVGLALILLVGMAACEQSKGRVDVPPPINKAFPHNHVPQGRSWQLVYVTFTSETTYEQAEQILGEMGMHHYPMVDNVPCDNLREIYNLDPMGSPCPVDTPMTTASLRADFHISHRMLVFTDSWEKLNKVTASPRVISVDPYPLPKNIPLKR